MRWHPLPGQLPLTRNFLTVISTRVFPLSIWDGMQRRSALLTALFRGSPIIPARGITAVLHPNISAMMTEAVEAFEKARKIDTGNTEILLSEGKALSRLEQFDKAIRIFDIALGIEPARGDLLLEKGIALAHLDRHDEAEKVFEESAAGMPDRFEPAFLRGLSLMILDRNAGCRAGIRQGDRSQPGRPGYLVS